MQHRRLRKRHLDLKQAGVTVDPSMLAPNPNPGHTWVRGVINHFDYQGSFNKSFPSLVHYLRLRKFRKFDDIVHHPGSGLPVRWQEGHPPVIKLITREEDENLRVLPR